MYKVQKGVPLPLDVRSKSKYPFLAMDVGDSFLAPKKKISTVSAAATYIAKKTKMKFITRKDGNGTRVWRVK